MDSRREKFRRVLAAPTVDLDVCDGDMDSWDVDSLPSEALGQYFEENAEEHILKQIGLDVPRTSPGVPFFHRPELQRSLTRILYIRAIRNPASGYVQGINDLVTPFLRVFLSELVRRIDEKIYNHLLDNNVEFLQFSFRWFNCLLLREFPFLLVDRLWDTYISEGDNFADFLVYACAAFLLTWSTKLLNMEFQDMIMFLQSPPTEHWTYDQVDTVMSKAFLWRAVFSHAQSHLK
eukprot:gene6037-7255_t